MDYSQMTRHLPSLKEVLNNLPTLYQKEFLKEFLKLVKQEDFASQILVNPALANYIMTFITERKRNLSRLKHKLSSSSATS